MINFNLDVKFPAPRALFPWQIFSKKNLLIFQLSPSHHIKYTKRHMFGAVNAGMVLNSAL
jgi:hypothetical protein